MGRPRLFDKTLPLNTRIPQEMYDRLTGFCATHGCSKAFATQKALDAYMQANDTGIKVDPVIRIDSNLYNVFVGTFPNEKQRTERLEEIVTLMLKSVKQPATSDTPQGDMHVADDVDVVKKGDN